MDSIRLRKVSKTYQSGRLKTPVLFDINLTISSGELVAVTGPSGSGKSTLVNLIGLLDRPTSGDLFLFNQQIKPNVSDRTRAKLRAEKIGFVFQNYILLPQVTVLENVLLPTIYKKTDRAQRQRALKLLSTLGLESRLQHLPTELSGGEKQRTAIARALMNDPEIILADEPTGNLDSENGSIILSILQLLHKNGKTIIIITHDQEVSRICPRKVFLLDGRICSSKECLNRYERRKNGTA